MRTYYVDPERNLEHNGTLYVGGSEIKLKESEAEPLLEVGILLKDKPAAALKADLATVLGERDSLARSIDWLKDTVAKATDLKALQALVAKGDKE